MNRRVRSLIACSAGVLAAASTSWGQTPSELCGNAPPVTPGVFQYTGAGANKDVVSTCGEVLNITDRWVRYQPIQSGPATVTLSGPCTTLVSIHTACPGTAANTVACSVGAVGPASVNFTAAANTPYLVRLVNVPVCSGPWTVTISGPPVGRGFMYQGRLKQDGAAVSGPADLTFSLWTQDAGGTQVGATETVGGVPVNEGLLTVELNRFNEFGAGAFDGSPRWLEIAVRSPAGSGPYTTLAPRQAVTPGALAWFAEHAANSDHAAQADEAVLAGTAHTLSAPGGPNDIVVVNSAGMVGIGTGSPTVRLDVRGDAGEPRILIGQVSSVASVDIVNTPGSMRAGLYIGPANQGYVYADVKNFRVPNPLNPATDIVYACPEGPEAAMYVRGTAHLQGGRAVITLPDHFTALAVEQGMTVQLTARSGASRGLAATHISLNGIAVEELLQGAGTYDFDWRVEAVRREHQDYRVIRDWRERSANIGTEQERWAQRLADIEQRKQRVRATEAAMNGRR